MSATTLAVDPVVEARVDHTLAGHVGALRHYIVDTVARAGVALDDETLDELSEAVLAESVRLAVRWVEEER